MAWDTVEEREATARPTPKAELRRTTVEQDALESVKGGILRQAKPKQVQPAHRSPRSQPVTWRLASWSRMAEDWTGTGPASWPGQPGTAPAPGLPWQQCGANQGVNAGRSAASVNCAEVDLW